MNSNNRLPDLINEYGGIENFRFFGHLNTPLGWFCSTPNDDWVECKFYPSDESLYNISYEDTYKCVFGVADETNTQYVNRCTYQSDVYSMLMNGTFLIKTSENQHIEKKIGMIKLTDTVNLMTNWEEVVDDTMT